MPPELTYLLGVLLTAVAAILLAAWLISGRIVRRRPPDLTDTPDNYGLPFEHVTFTARDGVELGGRLTSERGSQRPTVVFCAGMFGSMDGDAPLVPHFWRAGFDVLQFDWRGHGISDGPRVTLGLREPDDLRGALDFLQARGVPRIGLMGFSLGGAVALRTAAEDPRAACVVSDGGFATVEGALTGGVAERLGERTARVLRPLLWLVLRFVEVRLGERLSTASPLPVVGRIAPRPVLMIHGADDPLVPPAAQVALIEACQPPKALWQVEGAGHREAYERAPEEYLRRVLGFFRAGLAPGGPESVAQWGHSVVAHSAEEGEMAHKPVVVEQQALAVKQKYESDLLRRKNVIGVGVGWRTRDGKRTDEVTIVVTVTDKEPLDALDEKDVIPSELDGVPVDVLPVGEITSLPAPPDSSDADAGE